MAKDMVNATRIFNGKRYEFGGKWTSKKEAHKDARHVRDAGRRCRVTKLKGTYVVWVGPVIKT